MHELFDVGVSLRVLIDAVLSVDIRQGSLLFGYESKGWLAVSFFSESGNRSLAEVQWRSSETRQEFRPESRGESWRLSLLREVDDSQLLSGRVPQVGRTRCLVHYQLISIREKDTTSYSRDSHRADH